MTKLGDVAETFFASLGITKERYAAAKELIGLDPDCGCEQRREAMNKFGEHFGINNALSKFNQWRLDRHRRSGGTE